MENRDLKTVNIKNNMPEIVELLEDLMRSETISAQSVSQIERKLGSSVGAKVQVTLNIKKSYLHIFKKQFDF
jgi:hypothetical protein